MEIVSFPNDCRHLRFEVAETVMDQCPADGSVTWTCRGEEIDPDEAMAIAFGDFDLVGRAPGLGLPTPEVLVYRPADRRGRTNLASLPVRRWIPVTPHLWLATDGEVLLLAPEDPLLVENLTR